MRMTAGKLEQSALGCGNTPGPHNQHREAMLAMPRHSIAKPTARKSFRVIERKLYPSAGQEQSLEAYRVECCRLYNRALEQRIKAWKRRKESVSLYDQHALLTEQRGRMESLRAVPVWFLRSALGRLDKAFKAFFRRVQAKAHRKGFPRFRARRRYRSMEYAEARNYFREGVVFVPGIGEVAARGRDAVGKQKRLRLVKRIDTWYAQVIVEVQDAPPVEPRASVGLDMGLTAFATLSTGERIDNPRFLRKAERKLKRLQRRASRKRKGGRNWHKAVKRVAKIHERAKARRVDFCHREARKLVNRFDLIGVEALNIKGLASGMLAKSVCDAAWGFFLFCLTYKAENAGRRVVAVDPRGTSQECPGCGTVRAKSLSERRHQCSCGIVELDRDHAAALVIEARALGIAGASNLWRDGPLLGSACCSASPPSEAGSSTNSATH